MSRVDELKLLIAAGRADLKAEVFLQYLNELIEEVQIAFRQRQIEESKPTVQIVPRFVVPMRTKEDALAAHRAKHPELYNGDGTRKSTAPDYDPSKLGRQELHGKIETDEELERATRPDPPPPISKNARNDQIRTRAKQARTSNKGKLPQHWVKHVAREYDISVSLVYSIIYTDPAYEAVPRP